MREPSCDVGTRSSEANPVRLAFQLALPVVEEASRRFDLFGVACKHGVHVAVDVVCPSSCAREKRRCPGVGQASETMIPKRLPAGPAAC